MQKNSLMKRDDGIIRVLECHDDEVLMIDCKKLTMPTWKGIEALDGYIRCEDELDPKQYGTYKRLLCSRKTRAGIR